MNVLIIMKKIFLVLPAAASVCIPLHGQAKEGYENGYIVKVGQQAADFTIDERGDLF